MKVQRKKKNVITLLEIMIVIFLIGLIGSVIGFNVKGSLEEGKAFKTTQGIQQIQEILLLEMEKGASLEQILQSPAYYLKKSGLCKDANKLMKDGWGVRYTISEKVQKDGTSTLTVKSEALNKYQAKKKQGQPSSKGNLKPVESEDEEDDDES